MIQFDGKALMMLCLCNQLVTSAIRRYEYAMFCYAVDALLTLKGYFEGRTVASGRNRVSGESGKAIKP